MNSIINKIGVCVALSGVLVLSSCNKFLETEPDNRTTITTAQQISQLVSNAYPKASYIAFCEAMSDNAEDKGAPFSSQLNSQSYNFENVETIDYDTPEFYWTAAYKAISQANEALDVIEKSADKENLKGHKAEALVARAYAHFMLVNLFSKVYDGNAAQNPGIPYVTVPEKVVNGQYERKTVKYVYDMIEKDLTEGLPFINDALYDNAPKFHFNTAAAHAFASRFYLFKKEYDKVVAHATAAVSGSDLASSLEAIWLLA
jgi:starch-binding outer membrane protein, SusD/RagB family